MRMRTRTKVLLSVATVAVVAGAVGLYWFQPWKLVIDHRVEEKLPDAASAAKPPPAGARASQVAKPASTLLARGELITHEHETSGTVSVVRLANGSRVLTLADLDTTDGPQVEVWLTDAPVIAGEKGWHVFDDGNHVSLGGLKGNQGNQVYRVPKSVDLHDLTSVSLWCVRFAVSFGAAELEPVG